MACEVIFWHTFNPSRESSRKTHLEAYRQVRDTLCGTNP